MTATRLRTILRIWLASAAVFATSAGAAETSAPTAKQPSAFLVIYRAGPAWPKGKTLAELPLREHGRYMLALYKRGAMRMAGGFSDDSGGAAVLDVGDIESARAIAEADPAVTSGLFVYELRPWRLVPWEEIAARQPAPSSEADARR